jgi:hypothetical protein
MTEYRSVSTQPVKRFFVDMLTRDIAVDEAILDLLDNCVDGILRVRLEGSVPETPYEGFWAKITVAKDLFEIEDNCGGIPWSEHSRAFRMGRPKASEPQTGETQLSVGVYGIGMKRAIFKMGTQALIWTQNGNDNYEIDIDPEWMLAEDRWDLDVKAGQEQMAHDGTLIMVQTLHPAVSDLFAAESFKDSLLDKIQSHYAVIIQKGFKVEVNGTPAKPKPILFRFAPQKSLEDEIVRPYVFRSDNDGVQVFLAVGLREPIPDMERTLEEQEGPQFSSDYAGWTVICNDRVVLYCNRDELTGWGTGGVPRYHTQFIAISGVVEFRGDPLKLPTTTTKRGLDYSSRLYQQVLDRMRFGMRLFIDFTNRWKTRENEAKALVSPAPTLSYSGLKEEAENMSFAAVRIGLEGEQYKPKLPLPPSDVTDVRISYIREKEKVIRLAEDLLPDFERLRDRDVRRLVGEASFDYTYEQLIDTKK